MRQKKIAVLHAQVPFVRGGAESHVENLVKHLKLRGFVTELVSMPFKWYPNNALLDSYMMWRMADLREVNGEKIDLVIPLKVPTYAIKHPNKVTWVMHQHRAAYDLRNNPECGGLYTISGGAELSKRITQIDNIVLRESKLIYANSKNVASRLKEYNGIVAKPLYHPPAQVGKYYHESYGDYILSVGRLDKSKRIDLLIRALQYSNPCAKVVIAGKGPEDTALKKLARDLGVEKRVEFLGFVPDEDVLKLYANALAVCFPPIDEDYGYITLEAFLSQKPVITCCDSGGVLEFVVDNENGFIVNPEPKQIASCFDILYNDTQKVMQFGKAGYQRVKDISWDHVIDELTKTI